jgi:hypothetical protein
MNITVILDPTNVIMGGVLSQVLFIVHIIFQVHKLFKIKGISCKMT